MSHRGLYEVRKIPGYHDEPLKGKRTGQRSIRLNRAYRAIYIIYRNDVIHFVEVKEVNMSIKSKMSQKTLKDIEKITGTQLTLGKLIWAIRRADEISQVDLLKNLKFLSNICAI